MDDVQTFWLEETGEGSIWLRRFTLRDLPDHPRDCPEKYGYHTKAIDTGLIIPQAIVTSADGHRHYEAAPAPETFAGDPRWPTHCDCGMPFWGEDEWQVNVEQIMRRTDTGETMTMRDAPAGASWDAWWYYRVGPDGISLVVRIPRGDGQPSGPSEDWFVDSQASNCTRPDDPEHRCWVRHGDPRECHVRVDKNGRTCDAGGGSIASPTWHGFLRDGRLTLRDE